jgi:hypothetical protein
MALPPLLLAEGIHVDELLPGLGRPRLPQAPKARGEAAQLLS